MAVETRKDPRPAASIEVARQVEARKISRRSFLRVSVFSGMILSMIAMFAGFLGFFNRLKPVGFGGKVVVPKALVPPAGGAPVKVTAMKGWISNLQGSQGDVFQTGATGGVMAIYWKCPHLGCTVPWNASYNGAQVGFPGIIGWFKCPCHGSTYSRAGVRVYGPAPRSMDTFALVVNSDKSLTVDTGKITLGTIQDPLREVAYS